MVVLLKTILIGLIGTAERGDIHRDLILLK